MAYSPGGGDRGGKHGDLSRVGPAIFAPSFSRSSVKYNRAVYEDDRRDHDYGGYANSIHQQMKMSMYREWPGGVAYTKEVIPNQWDAYGASHHNKRRKRIGEDSSICLSETTQQLHHHNGAKKMYVPPYGGDRSSEGEIEKVNNEPPAASFDCIDNSFDGSFALFGDVGEAAALSAMENEAIVCWEMNRAVHFPEFGEMPAKPQQPVVAAASRTEDQQNPFDTFDCMAQSLLTSSEGAGSVIGPRQTGGAPEVLSHQNLLPRPNSQNLQGSTETNPAPIKGEWSSTQTTAVEDATDAVINVNHIERRGRGRSRGSAYSSDGGSDCSPPRPGLTDGALRELNDISEFRNNDKYRKHIVPYEEGISFPLGEGGRELLRACLNARGCKGRQLQGASVPCLLQLAQAWQLWDVALRIKVERSTGRLCPAHDAFVKFKATQSAQRKFVKKEYMVTERDPAGKIAKILYDENRKITLGKEGREILRAHLRRLHEKHAEKMDELLQKHGFKYSELRNATVQQLSRMAYVCNLWDEVETACRTQEEKRDTKGQGRQKQELGDEPENSDGHSSPAEDLQAAMQHFASTEDSSVNNDPSSVHRFVEDGEDFIDIFERPNALLEGADNVEHSNMQATEELIATLTRSDSSSHHPSSSFDSHDHSGGNPYDQDGNYYGSNDETATSTTGSLGLLQWDNSPS